LEPGVGAGPRRWLTLRRHWGSPARNATSTSARDNALRKEPLHFPRYVQAYVAARLAGRCLPRTVNIVTHGLHP
jgi:hypothetical protein